MFGSIHRTGHFFYMLAPLCNGRSWRFRPDHEGRRGTAHLFCAGDRRQQVRLRKERRARPAHPGAEKICQKFVLMCSFVFSFAFSVDMSRCPWVFWACPLTDVPICPVTQSCLSSGRSERKQRFPHSAQHGGETPNKGILRRLLESLRAFYWVFLSKSPK